MTPFTSLTAIAAPLPEDNVDTDIIVPARFLLITEKKGLGRYAFYERRYETDGRPKPDFVLNQPRFASAAILIAGANFGCGSSREHAPWALADLGFRAIIAPSFGEIFAGNCIKNGMPPVVVADVAPLIADAEAGRAVTIDLVARSVVRAGGTVIRFAIGDGAREALLNGWDDIETILGRHGGDITNFETRQRADQPWLWSNG
ncbi:3-isopropylmalate dehydratase small subunit [Sphingomonas sp. Leaf357]|uniref:3-isopropylmalate dehydratase small subunit n=1 Tax=Sphingomonas sp. Leaf357 TaxID=1736350 RepID=UPI000AC13BC1|nr:3-isopropylmalate dehydratase small subunit [Sphingomonas sp. Leaf357]